MAAALAAHAPGAGVLADDFTVAAALAAVDRALDALPALRAAARTAAPSWRDRHGFDRTYAGLVG
jgi:hypothetical protein